MRWHRVSVSSVSVCVHYHSLLSGAAEGRANLCSLRCLQGSHGVALAAEGGGTPDGLGRPKASELEVLHPRSDR